MTEDYRVLGNSISQVGEAPVWVPATQQVWWIDIFGGVLHRVDLADGSDDPWDLGERLAFAIPSRDDDQFVLGLADRAVLARAGSRDWTTVAGELDRGANTSINDAKCDRQGRLWFGTLDNDLVHPIASLSCAPDGQGASTRLTDLTICNGLGWSPDNRTMYVVDSAPHVLLAMSYDIETGSIGEPWPLISFDPGTGLPDGLSVDRTGNIWVVMYGGGALHRYTPEGTLAEVRRMPVSHPTSCCFVGDDLSQLLVTTSAWGPEKAGELDGASFIVDVDTPGLPVSHFAPGS